MRTWRDWLFGAKVRVLRLRPGDVVVVTTTDEPLTLETAEALKPTPPPGAPTTTRPDPWVSERRPRPDPWRKRGA